MTKLVEEGGYVAKVPVELIYEPDDPTGWGPYLSHDDMLKLDDGREKGRVTTAANLSHRPPDDIVARRAALRSTC